MYQSDNMRGLRVFDFDPSKSPPLNEIAYLELTTDHSNPRSINGAWSSYQFKSKVPGALAKVVMNTKTMGLFVLTVMDPATTKQTTKATIKSACVWFLPPQIPIFGHLDLSTILSG